MSLPSRSEIVKGVADRQAEIQARVERRVSQLLATAAKGVISAAARGKCEYKLFIGRSDADDWSSWMVAVSNRVIERVLEDDDFESGDPDAVGYDYRYHVIKKRGCMEKPYLFFVVISWPKVATDTVPVVDPILETLPREPT